MRLCIFHAACKQHLPFHKEKLICVSWSALRWESSTVLWIWDAETRCGVGVLSSLGRGSISGEQCWLGCVAARVYPLSWLQAVHPPVLHSPIHWKYGVRQLRCFVGSTLSRKNLLSKGRKWRCLELLFPRVFRLGSITKHNESWFLCRA